jgi:hypothetical protein
MWVRKTDDEVSRERRTPVWAHVVLWALLYALVSWIRGNPPGPIEELHPRTVICNRCHRVKIPDAELACACGGDFEDMRGWKWVDDPAAPAK